VNKRNTILVLLSSIVLILVVVETGLAADDRVFYGLIGLFVFTQITWVGYYLRRKRHNDLDRSLNQLFPDD